MNPPVVPVTLTLLRRKEVAQPVDVERNEVIRFKTGEPILGGPCEIQILELLLGGRPLSSSAAR